MTAMTPRVIIHGRCCGNWRSRPGKLTPWSAGQRRQHRGRRSAVRRARGGDGAPVAGRYGGEGRPPDPRAAGWGLGSRHRAPEPEAGRRGPGGPAISGRVGEVGTGGGVAGQAGGSERRCSAGGGEGPAGGDVGDRTRSARGGRRRALTCRAGGGGCGNAPGAARAPPAPRRARDRRGSSGAARSARRRRAGRIGDGWAGASWPTGYRTCVDREQWRGHQFGRRARMCRRDRRALLHRRARRRRPAATEVEFTRAPAATSGSPRPAGSSPPAGSTPARRCCCARPSCRPPATTGALLDLGCGYGPIACVLADRRARRPPSARSTSTSGPCELTADNAGRLGAGRPGRVGAPDDVPADVDFAADLVQPADPDRQGRAARAAAALAAPAGPGRRRPGWSSAGTSARDSLQRWLVEQGWQVERHASQKGFRVLRVTRIIRVDPATRARAGCLTVGYVDVAGGRAHPRRTGGSSSPTCRSGSARAPRSRWSARTARARRRCCGWSPATCRCSRRDRALRRAGRDAPVHRHDRRRVDARRPGAVAGPAGAARRRPRLAEAERPCARPRSAASSAPPTSKAQLAYADALAAWGEAGGYDAEVLFDTVARRRARPAVGRAPGTGRCAPSPAASRSASRWSCCCAAPTRCCCSTSRTTSSTCPASAGWRSGCASRPSRCSTFARPGAAGPDRRPGGRRRGRQRRGCTRAASPAGTRPGWPGYARLDELRRRWDEEHAEAQRAGADVQAEGRVQRRAWPRATRRRRPGCASSRRPGRRRVPPEGPGHPDAADAAGAPASAR